MTNFRRDDLQGFLDAKCAAGLSFSMVDHLRWDLKQMFEMAVAEDLIGKNPAKLLFTRGDAKRGEPSGNLAICFVRLRPTSLSADYLSGFRRPLMCCGLTLLLESLAAWGAKMSIYEVQLTMRCWKD